MENIKETKINLKDFDELKIGDPKEPKNVNITIENIIPQMEDIENPSFKKAIAGCIGLLIAGFCLGAGGSLAFSLICL